MKTLLLFTLCNLPFILLAQTNFKNENGAVIWQKIYITGEVIAPAIAATKLIGPQINETTVTGNIENSNVNYSISGTKRMKMPIYMLETFSASVIVEIKPDRYRVTVANIRFTDLEDGNRLTDKGTETIEFYVIDKTGNFKTSQQTALIALDADLTSRFTFNNNSEW